MNHLLVYAIETILCSGLFLGLYRLLISRKASYTFCRRYLVITLVLSALIPMLNVPVYVTAWAVPEQAAQTVEQTAAVLPVQTSRTEMAVEPYADAAFVTASDHVITEEHAARPDWDKVIAWAYLLGLLVSLALMLRSFAAISRLRKNSELKNEDGICLAENGNVKSPFSFLDTIFIGHISDACQRRQILSHEMSHIGHRHTQEKLLMSVVRSFLWFNPFAWLYEKQLEEVQEWQADADALSQGFDVDDYRNTVVMTLLGVNPAAASGLNGSFTKKRLLKMRTAESHGHAGPLTLATVALSAVCFSMFSLKLQAKPLESAIEADYSETGPFVEVPADEVEVPADEVEAPADEVEVPADEVEVPVDVVAAIPELHTVVADVPVEPVKPLNDNADPAVGLSDDMNELIRILALPNHREIMDSLLKQRQADERLPKSGRPVAGGSVNGHVLDIDGNPIKFRAIRVYERDLVERAVTMGSASADDGFFSLRSIKSPDNHLTFEAEGYEPQSFSLDRGTFEVRLKPAPVTLKPGDIVRGSVTCSQKAGSFTALHTAIGAKVEELDRNGNVVASTLTDEDGFSLTVVNPGDRLAVSIDGYSTVSTTIEIRNYQFNLNKIQ